MATARPSGSGVGSGVGYGAASARGPSSAQGPGSGGGRPNVGAFVGSAIGDFVGAGVGSDVVGEAVGANAGSPTIAASSDGIKLLLSSILLPGRRREANGARAREGGTSATPYRPLAFAFDDERDAAAV